MAKTELGIKVSGLNDLKLLNKALDDSKKGMRQYAQEAAKSGKASKPLVAIYSEQAAKLQKLGMAKKQAFGVAKELYQQELKAAKAGKDHTSSLKQQERAWKSLKRSIDPASAAGEDFTRKLNVLNRQFKDKSSAAYTRNLTLLRKQAAMAGVTISKMGKVVGVSNKSIARSNLAFQQAGYQVQDFIVQVQGGVNPLIAFSQQGSQLAGFFAGPWGAMIGLGIAALSTLGMALMAGGKEVKTFQDAISDAAEHLETFYDVSTRFGDDKLGETFGSMTFIIQGMSEAIKELSLEMAGLSLQAGTHDLFKKFADPKTAASGFWDWTKGGAQSLTRSIPLVGDLLGGEGPRTWTVQGRREAGGLGGFADEINVIRDLFERGDWEQVVSNIAVLLDEATASGVDLNAESSKFLLALSKAAEEAAKVEAASDHSATWEKVRNIIASVKEQLLPLDQAVNNVANTTNNWQNLLGKTHEEIKKAQDEASFMADVITALGEHATPKLVKDMNDFYHETKEAEAATLAMADALEDTDDNLADIRDMGEDVKIEIAKAEAQLKALERGADGATAAFIAGEKLKAEAALLTARALYEQTGNLIALAEASLAFVDIMGNLERLEALRNQLSDLKGGSTKKTDAEKAQEAVEALQRELDFRQSMVTVVDEQLAIETELFKLREKFGDAWTDTLDRQARAIIEQRQALEEYKKTMEGLADTISGSFGDALMSVVTGSATLEDALRTMALNIINELYRVLVVEQMVASMKASLMGGGNFLSSLVGSAFASGGVIDEGNRRAFFSGGLITHGPTLFAMAGGKTGLMGEAGPEAIMPLQRGKDGKLGVQVSDRDSGASSEGNSTKIINVLDPSIVGEFLNSRQGEKVIMNVMRRTGVI